MRKFFLFLLLTIPVICFSQTMNVKSFRLLETDLDANTSGLSMTDQNGETAALIKVVTTQTGFTFDGGSLSIVGTKQTPGEIWVYIPRGSKKITIKHPQLGVLRDYFFPCPIEAARTYEMILITGSVQTIVNEDAGGQYLVMTVDPPTATVYIDDIEATLQDGVLSNFLPYGKHTYRVTDPLYATDAGSFEIGKEKTELSIKLPPSYGVLEISTTPENGAKVYLDNNTDPIGTTPFTTKKLIKGQHKFRFQFPEYETKTITQDVHSDGTTKPLIVSLNPNFANITINTPENCELFINNESKGKGVWKGRLSEGLYRLEARLAGHQSSSQTLSVVKGEEQTVSIQKPIPLYGGLNINSNPIGATILIDGEKKGATPSILQEVLVGKHELSLVKNGYETKTQEITIEKGKIAELSLALDKEVVKKTVKEEKKQEPFISSAKQNSQIASFDDPEVNEALKAINDRSSDVEKLVSSVYKKNKKKPEILIAIGRAFYDQKDVENARRFANYANEGSRPMYQYAPSYMLLGDIEATFGTDGGKAVSYYNQAIVFDPKNPEGYKKWAMVYSKISPSQAAKKLEEMKVYCPDEDVEAFKGHIYMLANDEKLAYESYAKADIKKLDKLGLNEFARCSYFTGHFQDALNASEAGIKLEPRNPLFNRLAMFSNYELRNYEAAKSYINKYFKETDGAKFSEYDYFYAALTYDALGDKTCRYYYEKALELASDKSMIKRWAILKSISDSYLKDNDFENAIKYSNDYLKCKPDLGYDDYESMANIYIKYSENDESKMVEMTQKAIEIYNDLYVKFPINRAYSAFMCGGLSNKLDKNMERGLAKGYYQIVINLLEYDSNRSKGEDTMLKTSYHYMMYYAFMHKDINLSKEYANKILAIDPEYKPAIEVNKLK